MSKAFLEIWNGLLVKDILLVFLSAQLTNFLPCGNFDLFLSQLILILGYGPDSPRRKLFQQWVSSKVGENPSTDIHYQQKELASQPILPIRFSWWLVVHFILWASLWSCYVLLLCGISVRQYGGLGEMFKRYHIFLNFLKLHDMAEH